MRKYTPEERAQHLIWIDMEMSGLDPETCRPLEIATLVTDNNLVILAEGPNLVIHQPDEVLDAMDAWNTEHHTASGLVQGVRQSKVSTADAASLTLAFLRAWTEPGKSPMCGNSVGQDRRFLNRYMPELEDHFHYRNIDISTIKELSRRWYGLEPPAKRSSHRALDDIRESIDELHFYRANLFRDDV